LIKLSKLVIAMVSLLFVLAACASEVSRTTTPPTPIPPTSTPTATPAPTPTPTPTPKPAPTATPQLPTPTPLPTATPQPTATPVDIPDPLPERDIRELPHVFVGGVTIDGAPAPDGTEVSVWLKQFASPLATGTSVDGNYSVLASQFGIASFGGRRVIFKINGEDSGESAIWEKGGATILEVSLN
jgi:outer membrane biosynthesis protein TonB